MSEPLSQTEQGIAAQVAVAEVEKLMGTSRGRCGADVQYPSDDLIELPELGREPTHGLAKMSPLCGKPLTLIDR